MVEKIRRNEIGWIYWLLQDPSFDPSFNNNVLIQEAAEHGRLEIVELLLEDERVDPTADDNEALVLAAQGGHIEVVKRLLKDERINPFFYNPRSEKSPIRSAAIFNRIEILELLLSQPRPPPPDIRTQSRRRALFNISLRSAAQAGNLKSVEILLREDVDPSLHHAVIGGNLQIVEIILQDPRTDPSAGGWAAIRKAAEKGKVEIVRLLLEDGRIDPSENHNQALHLAEEGGHEEVVTLLMQDERVQTKLRSEYDISST